MGLKFRNVHEWAACRETEEKENACALCLMGKRKDFIREHTVKMNSIVTT